MLMLYLLNKLFHSRGIRRGIHHIEITGDFLGHRLLTLITF